MAFVLTSGEGVTASPLTISVACNKDFLGEGAALDLVAVLAGGELLVVGLVLAGHEGGSNPKSKKSRQCQSRPRVKRCRSARALENLLDGGSVEANISGEASDLAGNSLHAFLAGDDRAVDVIDALDNIVHGVDI